MTAEAAFKRIEGATSPADLFAGFPDPRKRYRALAVIVHPDKNPGEEDRAKGAFARLQEMWRRFEQGDLDPVYTFTTKRSRYTAAGPVLVDASCQVYAVQEPESEFNTFIRVPRAPRSDDLMQREATALRRFAGKHDDWDFPLAFVPHLQEVARSQDGRRFHVVRQATGLRTLHDLHTRLPAGVKLRDLAWMMRRVLTALAAAHKDGVAYGAPVPSNVAIQSELHGVVLTNWTSSADLRSAERVLCVDPRYKSLIAPEVLRREPATPASDLYTFSRTFKLLAGDYATPWFNAFVRGCSLERPTLRPQSAFDLREEFDDLLERAFGPRRFRPFVWPGEPVTQDTVSARS